MVFVHETGKRIPTWRPGDASLCFVFPYCAEGFKPGLKHKCACWFRTDLHRTPKAAPFGC